MNVFENTVGGSVSLRPATKFAKSVRSVFVRRFFRKSERTIKSSHVTPASESSTILKTWIILSKSLKNQDETRGLYRRGFPWESGRCRNRRSLSRSRPDRRISGRRNEQLCRILRALNGPPLRRVQPLRRA